MEMQEVVLFYNRLDVPTRQILHSRGAIPYKTANDAKVYIQEMVEYSQNWRGIQSNCSGILPKEQHEPFVPRTKAIYGRNPELIYGRIRKKHEENFNLIKEISASTDDAIRNQGASIKTLEIQIGQMSKVLQKRGFGSLPSSTKTNPRDQVKSISTSIEADASLIHRIGTPQYTKGSYGSQFLEAYSYGALYIDNSIPQKKKDPGSITLPYFINNVYFDNALADLGAIVSVMPLSTYLNLGLGELAHTKLTADRTVKYPKGIAENVLVGIGKFTMKS
ncbi:hypothetical protein Tco_1565418 [Tanacetum coccineum]